MRRMTDSDVFRFPGRFFQASHAPRFLSEILSVIFVLVLSPEKRLSKMVFKPLSALNLYSVTQSERIL